MNLGTKLLVQGLVTSVTNLPWVPLLSLPSTCLLSVVRLPCEFWDQALSTSCTCVQCLSQCNAGSDIIQISHSKTGDSNNVLKCDLCPFALMCLVSSLPAPISGRHLRICLPPCPLHSQWGETSQLRSTHLICTGPTWKSVGEAILGGTPHHFSQTCQRQSRGKEKMATSLGCLHYLISGLGSRGVGADGWEC